MAFLGYFFLGDRLRQPEQADLIGIVGDTAVTAGTWFVIGRERGFQPENWVNPLFQNDGLDGLPVEVVGYKDDDLLEQALVGRWTTDRARAFPVDSLYTPKAVESALLRKAKPAASYELIPWTALPPTTAEPSHDDSAAEGDQALIVALRRPRLRGAQREDWDGDLQRRVKELSQRLQEARAGEVDGLDRDGTLTVVYCYGSDALAMLEIARAPLAGLELAPGSVATARLGPAEDLNAEERRFELC